MMFSTFVIFVHLCTCLSILYQLFSKSMDRHRQKNRDVSPHPSPQTMMSCFPKLKDLLWQNFAFKCLVYEGHGMESIVRCKKIGKINIWLALF